MAFRGQNHNDKELNNKLENLILDNTMVSNVVTHKPNKTKLAKLDHNLLVSSVFQNDFRLLFFFFFFFFDYLSMCIIIIKCIPCISYSFYVRGLEVSFFLPFLCLFCLRLVKLLFFFLFLLSSCFLFFTSPLLFYVFLLLSFLRVIFFNSFFFFLQVPFCPSFCSINTVLSMPLSRQNLTFCYVKLISFKFHSSPSYLIWDLWCNHLTNWMSHGW